MILHSKKTYIIISQSVSRFHFSQSPVSLQLNECPVFLDTDCNDHRRFLGVGNLAKVDRLSNWQYNPYYRSICVITPEIVKENTSIRLEVTGCAIAQHHVHKYAPEYKIR